MRFLQYIWLRKNINIDKKISHIHVLLIFKIRILNYQVHKLKKSIICLVVKLTPKDKKNF